MSVILTGMDMPESCKECELRYLATSDDAYFGSSEERCVINYSRIEEKGKAYDCPLKSVDGLIEEIRRKANNGQWSDATVYGMRKAIAIIKEYCGIKACE